MSFSNYSSGLLRQLDEISRTPAFRAIAFSEAMLLFYNKILGIRINDPYLETASYIIGAAALGLALSK
jgi:hypothetical protein